MCGIDYNSFEFQGWERCKFGDSKISCYVCSGRFDEDKVLYDEEEDEYICNNCLEESK